ncbi:MAG: hypothetical protein HKN16_09865 [Saprospiraceae bacterium]|nr:hypothetical protein [Saprospiraceae bacterium]
MATYSKYTLSYFLALAFLCTSGVSLFGEVTYVLPLKGQEFQVGNLLEWATSEEINSEMFIVEKSLDGVEFEEVGSIDAAGESNHEMGYRFLDINASGDKAFYRLRQMDLDGSGSLSQTVMIRRIIPNQFSVVSMSNTSAAKQFRANIHATEEGLLEYVLMNQQKDLIQSGEVPMEFGLNELDISLENEAVGIYVLHLKVAQEIESLVIQKIEADPEVKNNVALKEKKKKN